MCKILISINPEYVNEILSGRKKYEYRKVKAKKDNVDKMIIYATAPVMKVVAEIEYGKTQKNIQVLAKLFMINIIKIEILRLHIN